MTRQLIRREEVQIEGSSICFSPSGDFADAYLSESLCVRYDAEVGLRDLPLSTLLLPLLLNVLPVAFLTNEMWHVPEIDAGLAASQKAIRHAFRRMYPQLCWDGGLVADLESSPKSCEPSASIGVLYSGGVDSTYTSLSNGDESQLLITVCGADISIDDGAAWKAVQEHTERFASDYGHASATVSANVVSFLRRSSLDHLTGGLGDWWMRIQHGPGLAGLCFPLLSHLGIHRLLIASSHWHEWPIAWGSTPQLDNAMHVASATVTHHGYDASRQDKLSYIVSRTGPHSVSPPFLRVCTRRHSGGGNCCSCEKCLRTIAGLLVEGAEPSAHGFPLSAREAAARTRHSFRYCRLKMGGGGLRKMWWKDIESRAKIRVEAGSALSEPYASFLAWFATFDFDRYARIEGYLSRTRKWVRILLSPRRVARALWRRAKRVVIRPTLLGL